MINSYRKSISTFIRAQSLTQIELTDEDIYRILNTQVFDGKVEIVDDSFKSNLYAFEHGSVLPNHNYRISNWYTPKIMFSDTPLLF